MQYPASLRPAVRPACGRIAGLSGLLSMAAVSLLAVSTVSVTPASAQVIERGIQGGVVGAVIGGLAGGGKGVGKGAAIGAGAGLAVGAIEKSNRERYYAAPPPPPPPGPPPMSGYARLVSRTQLALNRLGYSPGPVDGQMGPGTASAISKYQYAWGLPVTGQPSYPLLDHMKAHGG